MSDADLLPAEPLARRRSVGRVAAATLTLALFAVFYVLGGPLLLAAGVVGAGIAWGARRLLRVAPVRERRLLRELALRARGDADLPRRLVESELARSPGISRVRAAELALARLEHDRR